MGRNKLPEGQRKDAHVAFRCESRLKRKLEGIRKRKDITLVQVIREALKEYVARQESEAA